MDLFTIENGSFSYGSHTVFRDLTCTLQEGLFYGLIGPNGSGKSTLIDILMGGARLQAGNVRFAGADIASYPKRTLAKELSLVEQAVSIGFDFTVNDLVLMGRHPHIPRFSSPSREDLDLVEQALEKLDILHLRFRPVTQLSGGERQRVAVARALAQDTPVMLLDEPTASLDIRHALDIMRVLKQRVSRDYCTVIAAVHDLNLAAAFCDTLIVLNNTTIHAVGKTLDILTAELIDEVFAVEATVTRHCDILKIDYNMIY